MMILLEIKICIYFYSATFNRFNRIYKVLIMYYHCARISETPKKYRIKSFDYKEIVQILTSSSWTEVVSWKNDKDFAKLWVYDSDFGWEKPVGNMTFVWTQKWIQKGHQSIMFPALENLSAAFSWPQIEVATNEAIKRVGKG